MRNTATTRSTSLLPAILATVCAILASPQNTRAASVCGAGIEVDGKYIGGYAETWVGQSDRDLITQLANNHLTFERDYKLVVDKKDPKKATLSGKIRVASSVRNKDKLVAELKTLTLVKRNGKWYVADADVKKAAKVAKKPAGKKKKP